MNHNTQVNKNCHKQNYFSTKILSLSVSFKSKTSQSINVFPFRESSQRTQFVIGWSAMVVVIWIISGTRTSCCSSSKVHILTTWLLFGLEALESPTRIKNELTEHTCSGQIKKTAAPFLPCLTQFCHQRLFFAPKFLLWVNIFTRVCVCVCKIWISSGRHSDGQEKTKPAVDHCSGGTSPCSTGDSGHFARISFYMVNKWVAAPCFFVRCWDRCHARFVSEQNSPVIFFSAESSSRLFTGTESSGCLRESVLACAR